jgi:hypothetical protein
MGMPKLTPGEIHSRSTDWYHTLIYSGREKMVVEAVFKYIHLRKSSGISYITTFPPQKKKEIHLEEKKHLISNVVL